MVLENDLVKLQEAARPLRDYLAENGYCNCHTMAIVTLEGVRITADEEGVSFAFKPVEEEARCNDH